ncbi:MAG: hypothetical protein ACYC3W_03475 [Candidatus Nanopelagicales bacterium]
MRSRLIVGVLLFVVAFYALALLGMGAAFMAAGGLGIVMGLGLYAVLVASLWAVVREVRFGVDSMRLARTLTEEDGVPLDTVARDALGRPDPAAAELEWQRRKGIVDNAPNDWRAWFMLGIAYDNARDRRQGRAAVREAIRLYRQR